MSILFSFGTTGTLLYILQLAYYVLLLSFIHFDA